MPTQLVAHLRPLRLHRDGPPPDAGPGAYKALLDAIDRVDPAVTRVLHPDRGSAWTVSPWSLAALLEQERLVVGIAEPSPRLPGGIGAAVHQALRRCRRLTIGRSTYEVVGVPDPWQRDWRDLQPERPASEWGLRFVTPTTFRRAERSRAPTPLPSVELVFGRLVSRWTHFADVPLPAGTLDALEQHLELAAHRIETREHRVHQGRETGFVGDVTYRIAPRVLAAGTVDAGALCGIEALIACGTVLGVGDRTTMGMGAVSLLRRRHGPNTQQPG